jgi:3-methyl-2-oxobutanoate hydroxymethyltransferase
MDEMIHFASAVRRGAPDKFIVGDLPKASYEVQNSDAVINAMRFTKESRCDRVKLEGDGVTCKSLIKSGFSIKI